MINPVSSLDRYYQPPKPQKTGFNGTDNQTITLQADTTINMGTINGKPFDMKIHLNSGYQWSGAIPIKLTNGNIVTPEHKAAARAANAYSPREYNEGAAVSGAVHLLYLMADRGWAAQQFNDICSSTRKTQKDIENALDRLGIDKDKPFNINGRMFTYNFGILEDYKEE